MTLKQTMLAALAMAAMSTMTGIAPANAQYGYGGGGYGRDYGGDDYRPRRYERRFEDDDRPPPPRFGRRGGSICVTARGNCQYPPAPRNASCSCDIPGFGEKRGAIGGGY